MEKQEGHSITSELAPYSLENPHFQRRLISELFTLYDQIFGDNDLEMGGHLALNSGLEEMSKFYGKMEQSSRFILKGKGLEPLPATFDAFAEAVWPKFERSHYHDVTSLAGRLLVLGPESPIQIDEVLQGCRERVRQAAFRELLSMGPDNGRFIANDGASYQGKPLDAMNETIKLRRKEELTSNDQLRHRILQILEKDNEEISAEICEKHPQLYAIIVLLRSIIKREMMDGKYGSDAQIKARLSHLKASACHPSEIAPPVGSSDNVTSLQRPNAPAHPSSSQDES